MMPWVQWFKGEPQKRESVGILEGGVETPDNEFFVVSSKKKGVGMIKVVMTELRSKGRIQGKFREVLQPSQIIQMGRRKLAFNSFPSCHEDSELELQRLGQILCSSSM